MQDSNQNYLNLQEFRNAVKQGAVLSFEPAKNERTIVNTKDSGTAYYYKDNYQHYYYYAVNNKGIYNISEKIKRYVWPTSWHEIYKINPHTNSLFYVKQFFLALWVISAVAAIFLLIRKGVSKPPSISHPHL